MADSLAQILGVNGQSVEIRRFGRQPQRGHLKLSGSPATSISQHGELPSLLPALEFGPSDGTDTGDLDWATVKTIDLLSDLEQKSEPQVRFFDETKVSAYLWVRITLMDGEALEGKIENSIRFLCCSCIVLYPLEDEANRRCVCVPRNAIASLQVVALRQ